MLSSSRFRNYSLASLQKDIYAGMVVGVIAIPLGMAFAIASGVKPEYGIYTTIAAGIFISLLGGSKYQVSGPTGAFIPVLLAIVLQYGYSDLLVAGFMAGIILFLMGFFKLGSLIKYIPRPVTIGFTSGIAVLIFVGQVPNFLGLSDIERHEDFLSNAGEIFRNLGSINKYSVIVALISLTVIILTPRYTKKVPGSIVGLIVATLLSVIFFEEYIVTIGSAYGEIPNNLPSFQPLDLSLENIKSLIRPAFTIAMLGAIESLLSAVVADGMTGDNHNSNRELMGQGIGNMIIPFFGGIPATGAIARTATNIKNGAVSPVSAVVHSLTVLTILLLFAPYASHIPLAGMAPILMVVAWNMSERKQFVQVLKTKTGDSIVLVITFLLTLFTNLTTAVEIGLILAILLFVKRMSELLTVSKVLPDPSIKHEKLTSHMVYDGHDCPQISIYKVDGPLFFGAASLFTKTIISQINMQPKILLLRMSRVPFIDTTGEANLRSIIKNFQSTDGLVLISGIRKQPKEVLKKTGLYDLIGEGNFFEDTEQAIDYALKRINQNKCIGCRYNAFRECNQLSMGNEIETKPDGLGVVM